MFDIAEELKKLPQKPGVYIMKAESGEIIYVGKAVNLKNRVRSYFQPSSASDPKVRRLQANITEFEIIVVDNELEALILECNLIKTHNPRYNILLKDDKTYPYLKLTLNEAFPRLFITRKHEKDKSRYFGPYTNIYALNRTLEIISNIWQLRSCQKKFPRDEGKERPCLNHFIGKCAAPCNGKIEEAEYNKMIAEIIQFLNGKHTAVIKKLEAEMAEHSENLEFEKAAETRDKINSVRMLDERQKIEMNPGDDADIIAFAHASDEALVQVFFIRGGKITGREHFMLNSVENESREEIMTGFVKQFYGDTTFIPSEILVGDDVNEKEIITKWLSGLKGSNVTVTVPQKGEKLRLVELAAKNALLTFEQFGEQIKREKQKTEGAVAELCEALGTDKYFERIEAYDISNIMGFESVASMVVFESGKPKRSDYRKFKIKGVIGANDYASMEEVISRRLNRYKNEQNSDKPAFGKLPDALFIDGGKGQVHAAEKVLDEFGINIPVVGMIKDDKHRTRGMMYRDKEITLKTTGEGFKLLTRIQDEVHRFAIEYHRKLREKSQIRSTLDEIKGVGEVRRKALIKHFGSIEGIMRAEIDELAKVDSMNMKTAETVYNFFRNNC